MLPTLYRVWCRARRHVAAEWEDAHCRKYFWASKDKSSERAVRLQGLQAELARARGHHAAGLLTDLAKAYEYADHCKLVQFARQHGFPGDILAVCLGMYSGPRRIVTQGLCSTWFSADGQTIVAGCGMATTLLKVYTLTLFDAICKWHPQVDIHVYVDDVDLFTVSPSMRTASTNLTNAADFLLAMFEKALRLQVAHHKCVLLASSAKVEVQVRKDIRHKPHIACVQLQSWGKKLGIQFGLRGRRHAMLLKQRTTKAKLRAARIAKIRRAAGARTRT